jgi:hypothetical protein
VPASCRAIVSSPFQQCPCTATAPLASGGGVEKRAAEGLTGQHACQLALMREAREAASAVGGKAGAALPPAKLIECSSRRCGTGCGRSRHRQGVLALTASAVGSVPDKAACCGWQGRRRDDAMTLVLHGRAMGACMHVGRVVDMPSTNQLRRPCATGGDMCMSCIHACMHAWCSRSSLHGALPSP